MNSRLILFVMLGAVTAATAALVNKLSSKPFIHPRFMDNMVIQAWMRGRS